MTPRGLWPAAREWRHRGKRRLPRTVLYRVGQAGPELVDLTPCSLGDLTWRQAAISAGVQNFTDISIRSAARGLIGSGSCVLRYLLLTECRINVGDGRLSGAQCAQRSADASERGDHGATIVDHGRQNIPISEGGPIGVDRCDRRAREVDGPLVVVGLKQHRPQV